MRLSWDKKTVLVSDDKLAGTYPMTSSFESNILGFSEVPIWSLGPPIFRVLEELFDGCHKLFSERRMSVKTI